MTHLSKDHENLILGCLDQYNGTPEEFGELLYEATRPPYDFPDEKRNTARNIISHLKCGMRLILMEERILNGTMQNLPK